MSTTGIQFTDQPIAPTVSSDVMFAPEFRRRLGNIGRTTLARWQKLQLVPAPLAGYPGQRRAWSRAAVEEFLKRVGA